MLTAVGDAWILTQDEATFRADAVMTVQPWWRLSRAERDAVASEAESLPLPGIGGRIVVRWDD